MNIRPHVATPMASRQVRFGLMGLDAYTNPEEKALYEKLNKLNLPPSGVGLAVRLHDPIVADEPSYLFQPPNYKKPKSYHGSLEFWAVRDVDQLADTLKKVPGFTVQNWMEAEYDYNGKPLEVTMSGVMY